MNADYTLYLVTDRSLMSTKTLSEAVEQAILGGCTMVQLREKNLSSAEFYDQAIRVKRITDQYGVPLIINDRLDIALAVHASGVHLGQGDIPAHVARDLIGGDMLLGISVTSEKEAREAVKSGADYLGIGAMFPTGTKTDAIPVSIKQLRQIRNAVTLPIVVIGGIRKNNAGLFRPLGVDGLAVVSAIMASPDIKKRCGRIEGGFLRGKAGDCVSINIMNTAAAEGSRRKKDDWIMCCWGG